MYSLIRCLVDILAEEVKKSNDVKVGCLKHLISTLSNMIEPKFIYIAFNGYCYDKKLYLEIAKEALEKINPIYHNEYDVELQIDALKDFIKGAQDND